MLDAKTNVTSGIMLIIKDKIFKIDRIKGMLELL